MKMFLVLISFVFVFTACQGKVDKPKNLIPEDKMVDILYDFALIEGIKSDPTLNQSMLNSESFVYKKYNIDSTQFVQSNQYYASDIDNFKKIYDKVNEKIAVNQKKIEGKKDKKITKKEKIDNKNKAK